MTPFVIRQPAKQPASVRDGVSAVEWRLLRQEILDLIDEHFRVWREKDAFDEVSLLEIQRLLEK